jgi:hypothetical protein
LAQSEKLAEDLPSQWQRKQAGVAVFILDKVDFKHTLTKLIKGEMHKKEITIINLYARNVSAPNFIKHTLKDLCYHQ